MTKKKDRTAADIPANRSSVLGSREMLFADGKKPPQHIPDWNRHEADDRLLWRDTGMFLEICFPEFEDGLKQSLFLARQMQAKAIATGVFLDESTALLRMSEDICQGKSGEVPFEQMLAAVEKELVDLYLQMTPEEQAAVSDESQMPYGWRRNLASAWRLLKRLRSALDSGDLDNAVGLSYLLGQEANVCQLRRNFEHIVVRAKKQFGPLEEKKNREQSDKIIRQVAAFRELQKRFRQDSMTSPTEHLKAMSKVKVKHKNGEHATWGSLRTLQSYELISMLKSENQTNWH